ncbi:ribonuclease III [Mycoplasma zalophidermidis]|uniref:Ribonuclease 3 n=1 Tax=Mycoplasma zalophidermidis TaxID=398174 RepID=A0ABS6DTG6_9MOLU|nr:ribonuclease III [Mycoplasma zalophidermidis]MBU4689926.1 ribonuclease III [Mycoplasma zalophidermidis]MBU4693783.1 ribonuclease III [Mycoplasma zalophidermidis]MCR8966789.1 ribonuclease III [Mycoplasma zalophidermidis]
MNKKATEEFFAFLNKYSILPKKMSYYAVAFTHPSYAKTNKNKQLEDYQSMEFLGDSILQFLSSIYLYREYENSNPGNLSLMRTKLVSTKSLNNLSEKLNLKQFLLTGPGLMHEEILKSVKVGADIFESFIGALFLDQGLQKVNSFLQQTLFKTKIDESNLKDSKTLFQEYIQSFSRNSVTYNTTQNDSNSFHSKAIHDNNIYGEGEGKNKLEAEEQAAKNALSKLANTDE